MHTYRCIFVLMWIINFILLLHIFNKYMYVCAYISTWISTKQDGQRSQQNTIRLHLQLFSTSRTIRCNTHTHTHTCMQEQFSYKRTHRNLWVCKRINIHSITFTQPETSHTKHIRMNLRMAANDHLPTERSIKFLCGATSVWPGRRSVSQSQRNKFECLFREENILRAVCMYVYVRVICNVLMYVCVHIICIREYYCLCTTYFI